MSDTAGPIRDISAVDLPAALAAAERALETPAVLMTGGGLMGGPPTDDDKTLLARAVKQLAPLPDIAAALSQRLADAERKLAECHEAMRDIAGDVGDCDATSHSWCNVHSHVRKRNGPTCEVGATTAQCRALLRRHGAEPQTGEGK